MELYNIYHTIQGTDSAEYSPYSNPTVDDYMDQALASSDLEESYELWKLAQWDGTTGVTQDGDIPWVWLVTSTILIDIRIGTAFRWRSRKSIPTDMAGPLSTT